MPIGVLQQDCGRKDRELTRGLAVDSLRQDEHAVMPPNMSDRARSRVGLGTVQQIKQRSLSFGPDCKMETDVPEMSWEFPTRIRKEPPRHNPTISEAVRGLDAQQKSPRSAVAVADNGEEFDRRTEPLPLRLVIIVSLGNLDVSVSTTSIAIR